MYKYIDNKYTKKIVGLGDFNVHFGTKQNNKLVLCDLFIFSEFK